MADVESSKAQDDAFFAQLLADLEHDDAPAPVEKDVWASELPPAEPEFSAEDRCLRALLVSFYKTRNPENLGSVNAIVKTYRDHSCDLWAQLAVKYQLPAVEAVKLHAKTLYPSEAAQVTSEPFLDTAELTVKVEREGVDAVRAVLTSTSSIPPELRALCWKLQLGFLPPSSPNEWPNIQQGRREAYQRRWKDSLRMEGTNVIPLVADAQVAERLEALKDEVEQTCRHFHQVRQSSLLSIMALYLIASDGNLPLVQGMTHMAAVLLHVFTLALSPKDLAVSAGSAEADAFWCFAALMAEIKDRISDLQHSTALVHGLVGTSDSLLSKYDSDLAQHFQALGFEPGVVCLRWFMLLFAKDCELLDLLSYWDAFLADKQRFELAGYVSVAMLLQHRDDLLETSGLLDLAERLQQLPSRGSTGPGGLFEVTFGTPVLRLAWALRNFEHRLRAGKTPQFPVPSTVEVVQGVAGAFFSGIFSNF